MRAVFKGALGLLVLICAMIGVAVAAPVIELSVKVEKDIIEIGPNGQTTVKRVIATDATQGDVLFYTIIYKNSGDELATKVQLDNPITKETTYKADSAWGDNAEILFSIDQGTSFKKATEITYQLTGRNGKVEEHKVEPENYNAIRWVVDKILPGVEGSVGFTVRVN